MLQDRINIRHIICFIEVTRMGSVTRAAGNLNIAQSAVSRTLADLEAVVGVRLLERSRRGSALTPAGRAFHELVVPGFAYLREAYALANPDPDAVQIIKLGAVPTAVMSYLPEVLARFQGRNQKISVRVVEDRNIPLLDMLRAGEVDVVLGRLLSTEKIRGLAFEHLRDEQIICAVRPGHPLRERAEIDLRSLADWPVVINLPETMARAELGRLLVSRGVENLRALVETNSAQLARRLAMSEDRIWIAPEGTMSQDLTSGQLAALDVRGWSMQRPIGLWTNPKVNLSARTRELIGAIRELFYNTDVM